MRNVDINNATKHCFVNTETANAASGYPIVIAKQQLKLHTFTTENVCRRTGFTVGLQHIRAERSNY